MLDPRRIAAQAVREYAGKAYIARPITDIANDEQARALVVSWVKEIEEACERHNLQAYDPDRVSGLDAAPHMADPLVYNLDVARVRDADGLVALCTPTSTGVAMEILIAGLLGRPVLIVHPTTWQHRTFKLSRMLRGCPARVVETIAFTDPRDELPKLLDQAMPKLRDAIDDVAKMDRSAGSGKGLSLRIAAARHAAKIGEEELAKLLGTSVEHARVLEGKGPLADLPEGLRLRTESQAFPCLEPLRRLATILGKRLGWLLDGEQPGTGSRLAAEQWSAPDVRASWNNLLAAAGKEQAGLPALTRAWKSYEDDVIEHERRTELAGELIGNRDAWTVDDWRHRLRATGQATLFDDTEA